MPWPAMTIASQDPELFTWIARETRRQEEYLELIASENYVSSAVLEAQGSVLTNKYAEGYPGHRYYGGCEAVDGAEALAIERAKTLFGAAYANVQPHSGSQANLAVFQALLQPGDSFLAMDLNHGGHLTHGASVNFSGRWYRAFHYGVDPVHERIDMNQVRELAHAHRPRLIIAGFSAYSRIVDWAAFRTIADEVGAYFLADIAHVAGLIAAGLYPSPVSIADVTTTTTHKTLRGPRGGMILARDCPDLHKKLSSAIFPGTQGGPLMHVIAAKAVAFREAMAPEFKTYQTQVLNNARSLSSALGARGARIISGGTDNHLFLMDLRSVSPLGGHDAEKLLDRVHITLNKNTIPGETRTPRDPSGLRLGTPALTTRGLVPEDMDALASWMLEALRFPEDELRLDHIRNNVVELCLKHPVYGW